MKAASLAVAVFFVFVWILPAAAQETEDPVAIGERAEQLVQATVDNRAEADRLRPLYEQARSARP